MVKPTLDEIFGQRPSLDDIFAEKSGEVKPLSEEQKAKPKGVNYWEIAKAGLEGFGEGIEGGINRAINAASFGGYDLLSRKFLGDQYGKQQRELAQRAESAGVSGLNTLANVLTDIGAGGATTGNVAYNLAGKAGLTGLGQLAGAGALEGGAWGATGSDTLSQAATNIPTGAITGGALGFGLGATSNALKRFSPELSSVGLKTGLENALTDNNTIKALKRGAMDEDIANQLLSREAELKNTLNTRSADVLETLTGQRFDVASAKQANRQAYKDYFADNAEKQILGDRKQEQFDLINKINPMLDEYHTGIRSSKDIKSFSEAINDSDSFFWGDFSRNQAEDALHKGKIKVYSSKPIENGNFVSTSKNQAKDYSGGGKIYEKEIPIDDVAWINGDEGQVAIVGNKTLSNVLNPSTEFQKESLSKALSEANKMTNSKEGTLAHTNEVKKALNDMIDSSMTQGSNMQMKPTAKTNQLMELKSKLDDLLRQNSEIKNLDAEYSRLARLDEAYQKGFNANPRSKVNLANDEQKTAFLKGAADNILSDVKTDSDLSKAIMNKQNVLNKAMGKKEYQELMSKASDTSSQYDKLRNILSRAKITTGRYSNLENPYNLRELGDRKESAILYGLGKAANAIYGNTNRKVAQRIIDGLPMEEKSVLLEILARANPAYVGSYINQDFIGRE